METLKRNWLKAIMGLTLALGVGYFAVNASEKNVEAKDIKEEILTTSTVFHYASESVLPGAFADPDNWEEGPTPEGKDCGGEENKPCEKMALDKNDLESILLGKSNADILNDPSFSKRP